MRPPKVDVLITRCRSALPRRVDGAKGFHGIRVGARNGFTGGSELDYVATGIVRHCMQLESPVSTVREDVGEKLIAPPCLVDVGVVRVARLHVGPSPGNEGRSSKEHKSEIPRG